MSRPRTAVACRIAALAATLTLTAGTGLAVNPATWDIFFQTLGADVHIHPDTPVLDNEYQVYSHSYTLTRVEALVRILWSDQWIDITSYIDEGDRSGSGTSTNGLPVEFVNGRFGVEGVGADLHIWVSADGRGHADATAIQLGTVYGLDVRGIRVWGTVNAEGISKPMLTTGVGKGMGSISPSAGPQPYRAVVSVTASPHEDYEVEAWHGTDSDGSTASQNAVTMNGDRSVTVDFVLRLPGLAADPVPADGSTGVVLHPLLGWTPGLRGITQNVYFGTAPMPGAGQLLGNYNASTASVDPGMLSGSTTYYWRVDGLDAGGVVVARGPVWQFTTSPPRGSLQFKSATYPVNENGVTRRVYVSRTGGTYGAASVGYATANGTAAAGSDYTALSGTLNWADGDSVDKYATVMILDDSTCEESETFTVSLSGTSGASLGSPTSTTVTIADNDPGLAANPSPAHNATGVSPETLLGWTPGLRLSSQNVYFGTAPVPGAGQLLGNYSASTASADPGTPSAGTTYCWRVDGVAVGGVVVRGPVWQFTTSPPRGSLQFKSATYPVTENGVTRRVYVSRMGGSYGAASVGYATANGAAAAGSDYTALSGTLNWADGDSVDKYAAVPILDDTTYEESETFTVVLSGANGASLGSPASTTVTIADNDPPPVRHNLTVSVATGGSTIQPGQGVFTYDHGATVPIAASAAAHYHFVGWGGTAAQAGKVAQAAQASTTVTMDADYTLSAGFAENLAAMGTPQWWLAAHGLTEPWDAAELSDQDHDSMAAWKEWRSDTDPANANSVLRMFPPEIEPGGIRVRWKGGTGVLQYVESRGDLASPGDPWKAIYTNLPPTEVTNTVLDTGAARGPMMYRIKAVR